MSVEKIDQRLISKEIEGLSYQALKKAFTRTKKATRGFKNLNVRDPLDHIDFEVNLSGELGAIKNALERGSYHPQRPHIHYSPKSKGINRPTVSLCMEDIVVYRFCVEQIDEEIIKLTRRKNIHGGVMASPVADPTDGEFYEKWFDDWLEHNREVVEALNTREYIATTDIASYFDNINIPVLEDLLRELVKDKQNLLSLLFYFLENAKLRYGYRTKLNTGLLQDDIDCSRILAYLYLHPHDLKMFSFCQDHGADFFRFVDDMKIAVGSKTEAKVALKHLTASLRELGLMASIEKTTILSAADALDEMLYEENQQLGILQTKVESALAKGESTTHLSAELQELYHKFLSQKRNEKSNWIKVLKRFYGLATYLQSDQLFDAIPAQLVDYPALVATKKIHKYLLANQASPNFEKAILAVHAYLRSAENLYPQVESELIETLLNIDEQTLSNEAQMKILSLAIDLGMGKNEAQPAAQSEYSQGLSIYLMHKFDPESGSRERIVESFLQGNHPSIYVRKCMAVIALTTPKDKEREQVKQALRSDSAKEIKRILNLVENMATYRKKNPLKSYLNLQDHYIYFNNSDKKNPVEVKTKFSPFRVRILTELANIYS